MLYFKGIDSISSILDSISVKTIYKAPYKRYLRGFRRSVLFNISNDKEELSNYKQGSGFTV
jgi:hypothetical protein